MREKFGNKFPRKKIVGIITVILGFTILASACGITDSFATSTSDTHVCVFDGSERGGQKLKFQIAPGAKSKKIDSNDQAVKIPASNRFWNVSSDRNVADPGTPNNYTGNASGGVPVIVEGQIRFRFNLDLACEWYSKHGRRNANDGDLGFNARNNAQAGWFRFLNENFTVTMQEVASEQMNAYRWNYLHYNFPVNANEDGTVPAGQTAGVPTRQALGEALGKKFTTRLRDNLGDNYFCGIAGASADTPCPDIEFQVAYAGPGADSALVADRAKVEATRQQLDSSRLEGQLQQQQLDQTLAAETARGRILDAKAANAQKQAIIDNAKCLPLAQAGLDCEGHRPQPILTR